MKTTTAYKVCVITFLMFVLFCNFYGYLIFTEVNNHRLEQMVANTLPAVVHISCDAGWQGSGVIISEDGVVLTASHVIGDGGNTFTVTLSDGRKFTTQKSCVVRKYDVGYLKLEAKNLPTVSINDANSLRLGAQLFAIGSQFGAENFNSVTMGILSAHRRSIEDMDGWSILFQSDVGANPGSSGGPVFNIDGKLVGIVVGSPTQVYAGVIYCVPSEVFVKYMNAARAVFVEQDVKDTMEAEKVLVSSTQSEPESDHSFDPKIPSKN